MKSYKNELPFMLLGFLLTLLLLLIIISTENRIHNKHTLELEQKFSINKSMGEYIVKCPNGTYDKFAYNKSIVCNKFNEKFKVREYINFTTIT